MNRRSLLLVVLIALAVAPPAASASAPANGRIAFARDDPLLGDTETYTVNPDGTDLEPLLTGFTSGQPHWSPDGSRVAVISGLGAACPPTCTGNTVIVNPDTGSYDVLASQGFPAVSTFCSLWSPDGSQFACQGSNDSDPSVNGVYLIRASDGGGLTRITDAAGAADIPIDFSPDGKRLVFGRLDVNAGCNNKSALYVVNVDGSGLRRITPFGFCDDDGSWSPDGRTIAFEHKGQLFLVHPDGTGLRLFEFSHDSQTFAGDVSWSPDGTRLAFILGTHVGPRTFEEGIATAAADGSDVRYVTISPTFDHEADWGALPG